MACTEIKAGRTDQGLKIINPDGKARVYLLLQFVCYAICLYAICVRQFGTKEDLPPLMVHAFLQADRMQRSRVA